MGDAYLLVEEGVCDMQLENEKLIERISMSRQTVQKQGVHSGSKKAASTRHPFESAPSTSPTPGAFGKEAEPIMPDGKERQLAREAEQHVRKRRQKSARD